MKRIVAILLAIALCLGGCGKPLERTAEMTATAAEAADFGVRLFQAALEENRNTLISPLSVMTALAMTANGARGRTLEQMETVLGLDTQTMNRFFEDYLQILEQSKDAQLRLANAIWIREDPRLVIEQDFVDTNTECYGAQIRRSTFDGDMVREVNRWVSDRTDGMIPSLLDQVPDAAMMYLVNALVFDARWEEPYESADVRKGLFTDANGAQWNVPMMHSEEHFYLEDGGATGFLKFYEGGEYAFVALLPKEGISLRDYAATLTGARLRELLTGAEDVLVLASMPKFETEYDVELGGVLQQLGMTDAFREELADLSGLGTCGDSGLYISRVLHKTYIRVAEQGTRAAAATTVEVSVKGAQQLPPHKTVTLDRPFLYLLIDVQTGLPIFMGSVSEIQ